MILRPVKTRRPTEDDSFIGIRVGVLLMIGLALFGVLAFRLWFLQILTGDQYVASAQVNQGRAAVPIDGHIVTPPVPLVVSRGPCPPPLPASPG